MNEQARIELEEAVRLLESPGFGIRIADLVGSPIEKAIALLPDKATNTIGAAAQKAILGALRLSLKTMEHHDPGSGMPAPKASNRGHLGAVAVSGAIGGAFGLMALSIELPVSTTIMMRSIADIARSEGGDLGDIRTQLECVQILAFGGNASSDDAAEVGYFVAREAMTRAVAEAATWIAKHGLQKEAAPAVIRLIVQVAERYSVNVTEKAAAQLVPIVGAVGGAMINTIFMDHFQNMARGHFVIRRLERTHGEAAVRKAYLAAREKLRTGLPPPR